ncbi:hypothetical protein Tco_1299126 [Tanacetum coccineum]
MILQEEQQDFLADGLEEFDSDYDDLQLNTRSIFKANHVDAFDSDRVKHLRLVPNYDTYHETDMLDPVVQEMEHSEQLLDDNDSHTEFMSDNNVISYA